MVRVELRIEHLDQSADSCRIIASVVVECPYIADDVSHLVDRVVSSFRCTAVAGNALYINSDLHTASVSAVNSAVSRLCGDDELDFALRIFRTVEISVDDVLPAHAVAVLFHYGTNYHDFVSLRNESEVLHDPCAVYSRSHSSFLVGSAASVDDIVGLISLVRIICPVVYISNSYGIDVAVDSDDLVAVAHPADNVAECVYFDLVIAEFFHLGLDAHYDLFLLSALARVRYHIS